MADSDDPRRRLPGVDQLLEHPRIRELEEEIHREFITGVLREELASARKQIEMGENAPNRDQIVRGAVERLRTITTPMPRRVINASGVILHTGLGRAPLSDEARTAAMNAAGYCDLEIDMKGGGRGNRQVHVRDLLRRLTGAEDALVVNNNAAAVYLTLNVLAYRKEAIVSRGQLIEIGGSFRLPDIMRRAGVKLIEVGTTNRTRIGDFREAISDRTALLLRAYPSNFRIDGFEESVGVAELAKLGNETGRLVIDDLGGGVLWDWSDTGLPEEPTVRESLQAGADLVLFSGDKVLGGPQAGIIVGRKDLVEKLARNPLARVLRLDKLILAALNATLRAYFDTPGYRDHIPAWRMLTEDVNVLRTRADMMRNRMSKIADWEVLDVQPCQAEAGSGTLPAVKIPSFAVRCLPKRWKASRWARALRNAQIPVIATVHDNIVWLDLRTIQADEVNDTVRSVMWALVSRGS